MDKIAVVILNWNGCEMLRSFLPSVVRYSKTEGAKIYVADNGSTDASVDMLRQEFPDVHLIILKENLGFAEGYNLALQQVSAEYVMLLNSDVEVTEHWLVPLVSYMDAHPEVAACQPKIRSWRQKELFEYAGAAGGFIDRYGYPFCRGRIMSAVEKDNGQYDTVVPVFWATGAALFIRRKDYLDAGGLDGRFFRSYGRDRLVLATSCPRADAGLCTPKYRLSCRRCNLEKGESSLRLFSISVTIL